MGNVNTSLGMISSEKLGMVDAHEHVVIQGDEIHNLYPDFIHDDVSLISGELASWKKAGGGAIVDSSPIGAGRGIEKIIQISELTQVPVICSTGFHKQIYYSSDFLVFSEHEDELTKLMINECTIGIIKNEKTPWESDLFKVKAGAIKAAIDSNGLTRFTEKVLSAAIRAVDATEIPLFIHTEPGTPYLEIANWLNRNLGMMGKIVFCHMDRCPNSKIMEEVINLGITIEFDSMVRQKPTLEELSVVIHHLFNAGYGGKILFGGDLARQSYWKWYGGNPGLDYLIKGLDNEFSKYGIDKYFLDQIWTENPKRIFA